MNTLRPLQHLHFFGKRYPTAWKQVDVLRAGRGKDLPKWPSWCFLPLAGWYSIVSHAAAGGGAPVPLRLVPDIGRLAAVGTWRYTQGIYRFHPEVFKALWDTPLDRDLPAEVLLRLPEWGVYIETPGQEYGGASLHGFFAHLEWDANTAQHELRLVLDAEDDLIVSPLHLGQWPLAEAVDRALAQMVAQGNLAGIPMPIPGSDFSKFLAGVFRPLVSLLLYLCSDEPEIDSAREPASRPQRPQPKRVKGGWRLFPPSAPKMWLTGQKTGEAISLSHRDQQNQGLSQGDRKTPRTHLRRSHWHGYWTGPRDGERRFRYNWLAPIVVAPIENPEEKADTPD